MSPLPASQLVLPQPSSTSGGGGGGHSSVAFAQLSTFFKQERERDAELRQEMEGRLEALRRELNPAPPDDELVCPEALSQLQSRLEGLCDAQAKAPQPPVHCPFVSLNFSQSKTGDTNEGVCGLSVNLGCRVLLDRGSDLRCV